MKKIITQIAQGVLVYFLLALYGYYVENIKNAWIVAGIICLILGPIFYIASRKKK